MTDLITELKALKEKATLGALAGDGALLLHGHRAALARKLCNHLPTILAKLEEGERMREALMPFADHANRLEAGGQRPSDGYHTSVAMRDLRAARQALAALEPTHDH